MCARPGGHGYILGVHTARVAGFRTGRAGKQRVGVGTMRSAAARRLTALVLTLAGAFAAVSCGNDDPEPVFTVGADASTESVVLAHVYAQALARTGLRTAVATGLAAPHADLDAGRVAVLGARTGALLDRWQPAAPARKPADVAAAVNGALPQGLTVSDPADGADLRPRVLLDPALAARDGIASVADLAPRCVGYTAGYADLPGLAADPLGLRIDGCEFAASVRFPDAAELRKALRDGQVQAGVVAGPPALAGPAAEGLTVLGDSAYAVRAQNVLALYHSGVFDRVESRKLNYVSGELTTDGLVELIRAVDAGTPAEVAARTWLDAHAL